MIAVLDTGVSFTQSTSGILCQNGRKSYAGDSGLDRNGHGRNIIGIIAKRMDVKKQCILSYKVWTKDLSGQKSLDAVVSAIKDATSRGAKFINISLGGATYNMSELNAIKRANRRGAYVIVAAGNGYEDGPRKGQGKNFNTTKCNYYPACYREKYQHRKFKVVTTNIMRSSNKGDIVTNSERGYRVEGGGKTLSGTSQATAVLTSKLINK